MSCQHGGVTCDPLLDVRGLSISFGGPPVLDGVDLTLAPRSVTVVSGDNGAGKSTLLECLAGAQPYAAGTLLLGGRPVTPQSREHWLEVHAVLDDFAWFPGLSVHDHLLLLDPDLTRTQALDALDRLGAAHLVDRTPPTMSSGQRQRCALASAVVRPWTLLLLDEPERHLDADALPLVADLLQHLATQRETAGAVLVASHALALTVGPAVRHLRLAGGTLTDAT